MRARRKDQPREVERPKSDFYPTPDYAIRPLLEVETFDQPVWEPACGDGAISRMLEAIGVPVISTDLNPHGYGDTGVDFLMEQRLLAPDIVTNPPYKLADAFVRKGLELGARRIIMFLRLAYLEGTARSDIIERSGLEWIYVFRDRVTMYPAGEEVTGTSTTAFAWFVWNRGYDGPWKGRRLTTKKAIA